MKPSARIDNQATSLHYFLGGWRVVTAGSFLLKDELSIHLEPKVMDVLNYLALHQGELVTREALERDVWRGAVVGYDSITSAIIKLRRALGDDAHNPKYIETVPKRGYRLIALVEQARENEREVSALSAAETTTPRIGHQRKNAFPQWVMSLLIVLVILGVLLFELQNGQKPAFPHVTSGPKLSIMVLPFENLGDDPEQDYFTQGITEDLITDLSRISNLRVIASNTAFTYKNRQIEPQEIGEQLNVDYLLEGSVRRSGDALRVNARLIDTVSGFQAWASRYDRRLAEAFAVQDELTGNIVQALALRLTPKERELLSHKTTGNLQAYDLFQEGQRLSRITTRESNAEAQFAYQQAIEIDPAYGRAYGALAYNMALSYRRGWTASPGETLHRALELAKQGVALDNSIPQTYWSLGYVYLTNREFSEAMKAAMEAVAIAPNFGDAYGLLALIHVDLGEAEEAIDMVMKGMKLNPYFTWDYITSLGRAYYLSGRYEEAIASLIGAIERNEFSILPRLYLAACYVRLDRLEEARWQVDQIDVLNPETTLSHMRNTLPIKRPEMMNALLGDLRRAGLPE